MKTNVLIASCRFVSRAELMKTNVLICACLPCAAGAALVPQQQGSGEAEKYNDDSAFLETVHAMVEAKKALCIEDLGRFLSIFAGELSLQELQEGVGAEYCIKLLGRASESETTAQHGKPAMLRLPA
eukprot:3283200-Pleurochrysis_carterae.AAC.2